MCPTFTRSGSYQGLPTFYPVIAHQDGRREVLHGSPHANGITATKYAALEIRDRLRTT